MAPRRVFDSVSISYDVLNNTHTNKKSKKHNQEQVLEQSGRKKDQSIYCNYSFILTNSATTPPWGLPGLPDADDIPQSSSDDWDALPLPPLPDCENSFNKESCLDSDDDSLLNDHVLQNDCNGTTHQGLNT